MLAIRLQPPPFDLAVNGERYGKVEVGRVLAHLELPLALLESPEVLLVIPV